MKKTFSLVKIFLAQALFFSLLSSFGAAFFVNTTLAGPSPDPCQDISGRGIPIFQTATIANSGIVDFTDASYGPDTQYAGCVVDPGSDGVGPFQVEGWVWDTNLGWISLYCNNGFNLGLPCGSFNYGVTIDGPDAGASAGMLHGYAWGDNSGWISFNCSNSNSCGTRNYYVQPEAVGPQCLGQVYSGAQAGCTSHPNESTFAWSDNVGWINLSGVVFPWGAIIDNSKINVALSITPDPNTIGVNKTVVPKADGKDGYTMVLSFTDHNGTPITDLSPYTISALNVSWQDSVDLNQTDNQAAPANYSTCSNCGAVSKPITLGDFQQVGSTYTAKVTSVAPTSLMNGYDGRLDANGYQGETGNVTFPYENFVLPKVNPAGNGGIPPNVLGLNNISLSVKKGNGCAFGTDPACTPATVPNSTFRMQFRPAAEIADLNVNNKDYFSAQYNVATNFNTSAYCQPTAGSSLNCSQVTAKFQLGIDSPNSPFQFVDDTNHNSSLISYSLSQLPSSFQTVPILLPPNVQAAAQVDNPYVYSTISYTLNGKAVSYFSNKLPRVTGTLVANPVVSVKGNVYSTGITNPQTGTAIESLGDITTNILRDTLFRNVSNIIAGSPQPKGSALINDFNNGFVVKDSNTVTTLLPDTNNPSIPRAYYFNGDVTIDNNGVNNNTLNFSGERTIIVNGGNLYINSNLYKVPGGVSSKSHLGIIVFKGLQKGNGGNIYIGPKVTNIQANIFADNALFSYDGNAQHINSNGEPLFTSEQSRHDILINQLYIQGSIASMNTIGGAIRDIPILGDGRPETPIEGQYGSSPTGRAHTRLYDLDFLRYYGPVFERLPNGNVKDQQDPTNQNPDPSKIVATLVSQGGDLVPPQQAGIMALTPMGLDPNKDFNATYIDFEPPSTTLPGFNVTGNFSVKQLKQ